ncbi:MAG TPA: FlgD immunoglobulin-like domain containing protein, partial [Candidatus Udaeobacter sp.]|nr:FlgD immunoglobulin-like domain containing protein [Candidatus Udaeobacter sp.]
AQGFPIQLPGEIRSTPALWDLDRDGQMEIAVVCFDANVYVWDMTGTFNPINLPWPFFRHDTRNTGRYATPVQQVGITEPLPAPIVSVPAFHPAHPNPFNPSTILAFDVPGVANGARPVTLDIYDVGGRLIRRLVDGPVATGKHSITWDGRAKDGGRTASGIYFAKITIADFSATQKLTLVK